MARRVPQPIGYRRYWGWDYRKVHSTLWILPMEGTILLRFESQRELQKHIREVIGHRFPKVKKIMDRD